MNFVTKYVLEECCKCHMGFAISVDFQRRRREDHATFYCPNGHPQFYSGKSESEKLKGRLDQCQVTIDYLKEDANRAKEGRDRAERRRIAQKGATTKAKAAGQNLDGER